MVWVYCSVHGRGHENRIIEQQDSYREAGDSILIVHGPLKSGTHRCDKCKTLLKKGDAAVLMTAFPRFATESMNTYDFGNERRYCDLARASMKSYGAGWPAGDPAAVLSRRAADG